MGPDRFRFLSQPPASVPVRPRKIKAKSLFQNTLPLSPVGSRFCVRFRLSPSKQGFCKGEGEGVHPSRSFPLWEATRDASTQLPATGYQNPLVPAAIARQLLHDVSYELLGVAEEHQGVVEVVERVVDAGEAWAHAALDDHHG